MVIGPVNTIGPIADLMPSVELFHLFADVTSFLTGKYKLQKYLGMLVLHGLAGLKCNNEGC